MADSYNRSNDGIGGRVSHLSTINFNDTIKAYSGYIIEFERIVNGINRTTGTVIDKWKGKGRNAFEKDCKQVQLNLKDISDIMYNLRDALVNAHAEYIKTDLALSKSFEL